MNKRVNRLPKAVSICVIGLFFTALLMIFFDDPHKAQGLFRFKNLFFLSCIITMLVIFVLGIREWFKIATKLVKDKNFVGFAIQLLVLIFICITCLSVLRVFWLF